MTKEELLDILLSNQKLLFNLKATLKKHQDLYQDFLTWSFPDNFSFSQKLYHYLYDDPELKLGHCVVCNNRCKYRGFIEGYLECCSHKCAGNYEPKKIRTKQTCLKKYYVEHPMKNKYIKEKWKSICISECGETHYMKSEKSKTKQTETNIKRYGVENVMYISDVVERGRQTLFNKTGYYNISQTHEWAVKTHKKIKYKNISFDSNWELIVYKFCEEHNLNFEYQPNVLFEYEFDNKKHYYHPDFLIEGKLFEVKGEHFFDGDKMINPFNRNDYNDNIAEAKHQCMIKNNITIIRKNIIDNIDSLLSLL